MTDRDLDADLHVPALAPPPISAQLEGELARLAPAAPRRPMTQLARLAAISLVYAAGLLAILTVRDDAGELPMGWMVAAGLLWLLGFALPIGWALVPRRGSMMPRWKLAGGAAIVMAIGFIALGLAIHPSGPSSLDYGSEHFFAGHWCLELGVATALVPVVLGAMFLRGTLPVASRWVAAGLGAGGGSLGGLVLHLHCPIADLLHVGIIHGSVVGVSALLAVALVPRVTDVR